MRAIRLYIWLFLGLICLFFSAPAQSHTLSIEHPNDITPIHEKILVLDDTSGKLTIEDILIPENQKRFIPSSDQFWSEHQISNSVWYKFSLPKRTSSHWSLHFIRPFLNEIEVYEVSGTNIRLLTKEIPNTHIATREIDKPEFNLFLGNYNLPTYYIRSSSPSIEIPLLLGESNAIKKMELKGYLTQGVYFGILFLMMIYNLFLGINSRNRVYFIYSLYLLSLIWMMAFISQNAVNLFLPDITITYSGLALAVGSCYLLFIIFAVHFLELKTSHPRLARILLFLPALLLLSGTTMLFDMVHIGGILQKIFMTAMLLSLMVIGIIKWRKHFPLAGYYSLAWGLYSLGFIIGVLADSGVIPYNSSTIYSLYFGSLLEVFILTFAITLQLKRNQENSMMQVKFSEDRYHQLSDMANEGLLIHENFVIKKVNRAFLEMFEYTEEEIIGKDGSVLLPQTAVDTISQYMNKGSSGPTEMIAYAKSGREIPIRTWGKDLLGSSKERVVIIHDLTKLKEKENEVKEREEQLTKIYNGTFDMMGLVKYENERFVVKSANVPALHANEIAGLSKEDFINADLENYLQERRSFDESAVNELLSAYREVMKTQKMVHLEHALKNPEQSPMYLETRLYPIFDEDGECEFVLWVTRDITVSKLNEKELLANVLKGEDFERKRIAKELHDSLGQTLTVASMYLHSLKDQLDASDQSKEAHENAVRSLTMAIEDTRNISRNLMPKVLDDFGYLQAVEALLKPINDIAETKFEFFHNLHDERFDASIETGLYRITQEGVNNILKYAQAKTAGIQLMKSDESLTLTIEDDGIGFKVPQEISKKSQGLSNMINRVNALSGSIEIDSHPGKGTIISIEIPF